MDNSNDLKSTINSKKKIAQSSTAASNNVKGGALSKEISRFNVPEEVPEDPIELDHIPKVKLELSREM